MPINTIIIIFGFMVSAIMLLIMWCNRKNHKLNPNLSSIIGQAGHGTALNQTKN